MVFLPADWREVKGNGARAYRKIGASSGWLNISLLPPEPSLCGDDHATSTRLRKLLDDLGMPLGREVHADTTDCTLGRMAFSIWKSPERGLLQFWLIPSEVMVFASYTMGNLRTAQQEMADAHSIIESLHFVDSEVSF